MNQRQRVCDGGSRRAWQVSDEVYAIQETPQSYPLPAPSEKALMGAAKTGRREASQSARRLERAAARPLRSHCTTEGLIMRGGRSDSGLRQSILRDRPFGG